MSAIMLVNGKPHRLCDCDPHKGECPRGIKRTLATTDFSRCLIPAPDVLIAGTAVPEALRIDDVGAVAWAYRKLKAFGVHTGTIDSAMMMDRLNAILTTECPGTQASSVGAVPAPSAPSPLRQKP